MILPKYSSEPSSEFEGGYDVVKFDANREPEPVVKGLSEPEAKRRAKCLNDKYTLKIRESFLRDPTNFHCFVENYNPTNFYILLNFRTGWDDVFLIKFCGTDVVSVLKGSNPEERSIICNEFTSKWKNISTSGYTEYNLEDFLPIDVTVVKSKIGAIVNGINNK